MTTTTTGKPARHVRSDGAEIVITAYRHPPGDYVSGTTTSTTWTATWHLDPDPAGEESGDVIGPLTDPADPASWQAAWSTEAEALAVGHAAARAHLAGEADHRPAGYHGPLLAGYDRSEDQ